MKAAYVMQMEQQEKKKAEEHAEEEKIRDALLAKFADDERLEQMNAQKRRIRVEAHKREAQRLIDLRKEAFQKARDDERAEEERKRSEEINRLNVVEEERKRLILEHGIPLKDFLPKGTLQTKDDYDMIFRENPLNPYVAKRPGNLTA